MKNKIINVTKEEVEVIRKNAIQDADTYFAEINGSNIKTEADYVQAMANVFAFPHKLPKLIIGWYNDYITDLLWIQQSDIILIIHNYEQMLVDNIDLKEEIISDFKEIILPWWEDEVVGHMVGGVPRKFLVYLEIQ